MLLWPITGKMIRLDFYRRAPGSLPVRIFNRAVLKVSFLLGSLIFTNLAPASLATSSEGEESLPFVLIPMVSGLEVLPQSPQMHRKVSMEVPLPLRMVAPKRMNMASYLV